MAGTTTKSTVTTSREGDVASVIVEHNKLVDDVEAVRAASVATHLYAVEDLAAGADIAARGLYQAQAAETVVDARVVPFGTGAGIDAGNSSVITLRNITEGVDIATVTQTAAFTANTPVALAITAANADVAASDVLGLVVTNGATADTPAFVLQFAVQRQTVDAAADMTAAKIGDRSGTARS